MATWTSILARSAALLNDQDRATYTDTVLLPYLNTALSELQEIFELNDIPSTHETSDTIAVPSSTSAIGFSTVPPLPSDLIEIKELWESPTDQGLWTRVVKREFLTGYIPGTTEVAIFGVWAWIDQEIRLLAANTPIDLKLDYIKNLFAELILSELGDQNIILNTETFFQYRTAGLAAEFIEENDIRADRLNTYGASSLNRSLGISVKAAQQIAVRRRPFRAAYKRRRVLA